MEYDIRQLENQFWVVFVNDQPVATAVSYTGALRAYIKYLAEENERLADALAKVHHDCTA